MPDLLRITTTFLLAATALVAAPPAAHAQDEAPPSAEVLEARERVERGEALFERGDYDAALVELERAYRVIGEHPQRYLVLFNIGQCHERLFRYDEALSFYRRYLEEGGADAADREVVEATVRTLEGMLATLDIESNVAAEVWIDERSVGHAPGTIRVPGGRHVIELRAAGHEPARREVQAPARTEHHLVFELRALAESYRGLPVAAFVITAASAGAAIVAGGIVGGVALGERGSIDRRLGDDVERWSVTEADRERIRSLGVTADALFVAGAAVGVTAVVLALLTDWGGAPAEEPDPAQREARLRRSDRLRASSVRASSLRASSLRASSPRPWSLRPWSPAGAELGLGIAGDL